MEGEQVTSAAEASASSHDHIPVKMDYSVYDPSSGTGESSLAPIIFVHGLFCSRVMHEHIVKDLSEATGRTVYSVDLPCHGTSPRVSCVSLQTIKMDFKQFIEDRDIETKVIFICHSVSCILVHAFAVDYPDIVEKLVMIDHPPDVTLTKTEAFPFSYEQMRNQNKILQFLKPEYTLPQAKKVLLGLSARAATETQKAFLKKAAHELTKKSGRFEWTIDFNFLLNNTKVLDYHQTKPYYKEILLIRALDCPITTDEAVAHAQKLNPNMKVITYENGGHMLFLEHPHRFVKDVATYLKE